MIASLPSIGSAAQLTRSGKLTPLEILEFCLDRIERFDDAVHAWVVVDAEGALRQAQQQTEDLSRGLECGLLHGIPIGIKDVIDVEGLPTVAGSPLRKHHVAHRDASVVAKLRKAGAIILGKTVTCEYACFDPSPTRNPWNEQHTPGGSSSGSAAAVATQMCIAALGTQTGGSITRPASYCGVAGLKPTHGLVEMDGIVLVSQRLDHVGPMARTAADLQLVFQAIIDHDAMRQSTEYPKLTVIEDYFMESADECVAEATQSALHRLQNASSEQRRGSLPTSFQDVHIMHRRIMAVDAAANHRDQFQKSPRGFGPNISSLIEEGLALSREKYIAALEHQQYFKKDVESLFADGHLAVTPATDTTAPARLDTTGDPRFQSPWSYAGLPTVTIPCGLNAAGMPCGLQFVGPRYSENRLLGAATWCEQRLGMADVLPRYRNCPNARNQER